MSDAPPPDERPLGGAMPEPIEALADAVELAFGRLDDEHVAFGRHVVDKATERLRHGTTNTLVALLGATGSGKSSVANAIVGDDVATAGVRRPTTSSTLACYWADSDDRTEERSVQQLLDWLEVKNRHGVTTNAVGQAGTGMAGGHEALTGLVLLDVPDHDSVAVEHRLEMERIAEHADMLLWVTDHEKYADKAMHDYLRRLGGHGAVTAMVLNKTDQLDEADVDRCAADLGRLLADAGLDGAPIHAVSAVTGDGVEGLKRELAEAVSRQRAVVDRLLADTRQAAEALTAELGSPGDRRSTGGPSGKELDKRLDRTAKTLAQDLVGASGLDAVCSAVEAGHRRDAASRTGWPFTRWVRKLRPHPLRRLHLGQGTAGRSSLPEVSGVQKARTEGAIRTAASDVTEGLPAPWPDLIRDAAAPDPTTLNDRLDRAISDSVRAQRSKKPAWWLVVNFLQTVLAVATLAGAGWLGLLAFGAYLRLPEPPTPEYRGMPIPTGLLLGGIVLGLLVAFLAGRFAALGARRRSRAVRKRAEEAVRTTSDELVIEPIRAELDRRRELQRLLTAAGAGR